MKTYYIESTYEMKKYTFNKSFWRSIPPNYSPFNGRDSWPVGEYPTEEEARKHFDNRTTVEYYCGGINIRGYRLAVETVEEDYWNYEVIEESRIPEGTECEGFVLRDGEWVEIEEEDDE